MNPQLTSLDKFIINYYNCIILEDTSYIPFVSKLSKQMDVTNIHPTSIHQNVWPWWMPHSDSRYLYII